MKLNRLLAIVLSVLLICALFAACGKRGESASNSGENAGTSNAKIVDIDNDKIKVAVAVANMDTNTSIWVEGIEDAYEGYPNVTVQVFTANGSAETQSTQLQEIINQEFDAIIIHPVDTAGSASLTTKAEEAGINVFHLNVGPEAVHSGGLENSSYNLGALAAKDAIERTGGAAKCVAIGPPVALSSIALGVNGFQETLATASGMEFLESQAGDWTTENANAIMRDLLSKYNNDIQVVFAHNDQMAIGAAQAIEAAGLTGKILIYGADGSEDGVQYIADGKMTGSICVDNHQMGMSIAQYALYAMATGVDGSKLPRTPIIAVPQIIVSDQNVSEYLK